MTTRKNKQKRFWLPVIVLALALALGGCARAGQTASGPSTGATGQGNTQQELQNLQGTDQQNQNDLNGLGNDDNTTNQNQGDDQENQP